MGFSHSSEQKFQKWQEKGPQERPLFGPKTMTKHDNKRSKTELSSCGGGEGNKVILKQKKLKK